MAHQRDNRDLTSADFEREWVVTVNTPSGGAPPVLQALGSELPLSQGRYDNVLFVRKNCAQRFRAREGSHAGAEGTIQETPAEQIIFSLPPDPALLDKAFEVIFAVHVHEEPTIRVREEWGSRSHLNPRGERDF